MKSSQILKSPFRRAAHIQQDGMRGKKVFLIKGGGSNYGKSNNGSKFRQQIQTNQRKYGKYTFFKQNLLQHEFSSRNKLKMEIRKCSPIVKNVFFFKQSSTRSNSREAKTFQKFKILAL